MNKLIDNFKNLKYWLMSKNKELQAALVIAMMIPLRVSADTGTASVMNAALGVVFDIFMYVGIFVIIFGAVNLFNSIQQQDGDRQQKAVTGLVIGGALIGLRAVSYTHLTLPTIA